MALLRYRCAQCDAFGRPVRTRAEAEAQRARHRRLVHGGLVPRGERIEHVAGHDARDPDARYVSTRAVLGLLLILTVASLLARVFGH